MDIQKQFDQFLQDKLDEKRSSGLLRSLIHAGDKIDFSSNDYFGFSRNPLLQHISGQSLPAGATGSRSITGNSPEAIDAEKSIAAFHRAEAALIFNAGYMANVGLFSCLASRGDTYISDEYIHASIIDGMRLNHANRLKFRHNDVADLEKKLLAATGKKFVAIESIYSMDGDEAPLQEIVEICKKHDALLIVDEAHATGVFGKRGEGLVCHYQLEKEIYACVYTFGKALGLHGAAVVGSTVLRDYLLNHARSFIFATALPPHSYLQIQKAYQALPGADRKSLYELIDYFREAKTKYPNITFMDSRSAIQGIIIGDSFKARALSEHLFSKGIFVKAILPPTVPAGTERLRICLHTFNTREQVDLLLSAVNQFLS